MTDADIKENIKKAITKFVDKDMEQLYKVDIYEPTISHRIAVYLEKLFPDYSVDCEYNRNLSENKTAPSGKKIRPDIVIHKRGESKNNLVFIEIKKKGKGTLAAKKDIEKLNGAINEPLLYKFGVYIGILKKRIDICWVDKKGVLEETINLK